MEIKQSSILYITIYKPPQNFIDDFTELLSIVCTAFDCLVITGDLNVHLDVAQDKQAKELISVLEMFGLTQHVTKPTHSRGHTLDVLISKGVVISNLDVVDVALSDHFCFFFDLSVTPKPAVGSAVVRGRLINDRTGTQFMELSRFENTLCSNVDDLLNSYTSSPLLLSRLEWLKVGKGRHGEKKSRSGHRKGSAREPNELQIHYEVYKEKLCVFNQTLLQ